MNKRKGNNLMKEFFCQFETYRLVWQDLVSKNWNQFFDRFKEIKMFCSRPINFIW